MRALDGCKEVYLSTDPENLAGKHVYEKAGFRPLHRMLDGEALYKYVFQEEQGKWRFGTRRKRSCPR